VTMLTSVLTFSTVALVATLPWAPAQADPLPSLHKAGIVDDVGGAQRVNMAGKLRMLSQRIPAAACNEAGGIAVAEAAATLKAAVAEFDRILNALEFGDGGLGIHGPETDRKVLADIQALHGVWDPLHADMDAMIEGDTDRAHAEKIVAMEPTLLEIAKHLVSMEVAEHSDPAAMLQGDAILIDIAGRQRMLAQRLSKDACMLAEGLEAERARADLGKTREMYQVSLRALRFGMADAGIAPPPTAEIEAGLARVNAIWEEIQPWLDATLDGTITPEQRANLMRRANALTGSMNEVVGMYSRASQLNL